MNVWSEVVNLKNFNYLFIVCVVLAVVFFAVLQL